MSHSSRLSFTKMKGAVNDYVYIDTLRSPTTADIANIDIPTLSRKISDRYFGVGNDGLIIVTSYSNADFHMRLFNTYCKEAQICGNGTRCVAKYLYEKDSHKGNVRLNTCLGNTDYPTLPAQDLAPQVKYIYDLQGVNSREKTLVAMSKQYHIHHINMKTTVKSSDCNSPHYATARQ